MTIDWSAVLIALIGSSGAASIVTAVLNRRWKKRDEAEAKRFVTPEELEQMKSTLYAVAEATKAMMAHEIRCVGSSYIYAGEISIDDKTAFDNMYNKYMALPGADGLCGTVKSVVDKLPVVSGEADA